MNFNKKEYQEYVKSRAARSPIVKNCALAFLFGGGICGIAEGFKLLLIHLGLDKELASVCISVSLILIAAVLTGVGVFDTIAKRAGAGTLVPITGFANSVVSPAMDNKSEGLILGVGAKIFTVAGPVLLYGLLSGVLYGAIYFTVTLFL